MLIGQNSTNYWSLLGTRRNGKTLNRVMEAKVLRHSKTHLANVCRGATERISYRSLIDTRRAVGNRRRAARGLTTLS
jgi:hypothetical protein